MTINLQVLSSTDCLLSFKEAAPRAVIFLQEDTIRQAFIVADEDVKLEIPEPTTAKILVGLVSAYYAWHRNYPTAYANLLDFLAYRIFGARLKNDTTVAKFLRKLNNFYASSSSGKTND